jgi:hypothetical protein
MALRRIQLKFYVKIARYRRLGMEIRNTYRISVEKHFKRPPEEPRRGRKDDTKVVLR